MIFHKITNNVVIHGMLAAFCSMPTIANATPDNNQIIFWIGTQNVLIKKRSVLPNVQQRLNPSNIKDLKLIKKHQNNDILTMQEAAKYTFTYFYEKNISCDANITYTWTRLKSNYELRSLIVDCQV